MDGGGRWVPFALLVPVWLTACDKANEPTRRNSEPGSRAEAGSLDSYGLVDVAGVDNGGFGTCTEDTELFAGCEAPGAQTVEIESSPDTTTALETPYAVIVDRSALSATADASTRYTAGGEDAGEAPSAPPLPGLTDRCGQTEPSARTPAVAEPDGTATGTGCSCGTKLCMCG